MAGTVNLASITFKMEMRNLALVVGITVYGDIGLVKGNAQGIGGHDWFNTYLLIIYSPPNIPRTVLAAGVMTVNKNRGSFLMELMF